MLQGHKLPQDYTKAVNIWFFIWLLITEYFWGHPLRLKKRVQNCKLKFVTKSMFRLYNIQYKEVHVTTYWFQSSTYSPCSICRWNICLHFWAWETEITNLDKHFPVSLLIQSTLMNIPTKDMRSVHIFIAIKLACSLLFLKEYKRYLGH